MNINEKKNDFEINKALESVKIEKENLQCCLKEIINTRKTVEANLNDASNAINSFKIQSLDKEVNILEEKQAKLTEQIKSLNVKTKEHKHNTDIATNALTRKANNLCELFLAAAHIKTDDSKYLKIFSDTDELKLELMEKEKKLCRVKKELEEFVFYEASEDQTELLVSLDERQLVMNFLENQFSDIKQKLNELKVIEDGLK